MQLLRALLPVGFACLLTTLRNTGENTDGSAADMEFLRAHSADQLEGISETNMVAVPSQGQTGLNDCCGGWQIHGFVCEHYAAPDTFVIGLNRGYTDAEAFCQSEYHGHLASIKSQADYDKMMEMATGFTEPLLVGGKLGGNPSLWTWEDGSYFDLSFIEAHSWDQLATTEGTEQENQMVLYPPCVPRPPWAPLLFCAD